MGRRNCFINLKEMLIDHATSRKKSLHIRNSIISGIVILLYFRMRIATVDKKGKITHLKSTGIQLKSFKKDEVTLSMILFVSSTLKKD